MLLLPGYKLETAIATPTSSAISIKLTRSH